MSTTAILYQRRMHRTGTDVDWLRGLVVLNDTRLSSNARRLILSECRAAGQ